MNLQNFQALLTLGVKKGASDIHLQAGYPPSYRINGNLYSAKMEPLRPEETQAAVGFILGDTTPPREGEDEVDCGYSLPGVSRFRANIFRQRGSFGVAMRVIPFEIPTLETLNVPRVVSRIADAHQGLVLITGATGEGKSTTIAALLQKMNTAEHLHIITIEDPIEFVHKTKKCLVNQRELGVHTLSFANALKSALREDPDIILVGEMRDLETIQLALTAAETGHLVFGTLHTSSAPKTIDRIIDAFPPAQQAQIRTQLSEALEAVITQTLLKKKAGGRVAALEVMVATTAVRNLIREGKLHQIPGIMQASQKDGMQTMDMALVELATRGVVTKAEAQSRSMSPNLFGGSALSGAA
jgi:twitching motility protein PilT